MGMTLYATRTRQACDTQEPMFGSSSHGVTAQLPREEVLAAHRSDGLLATFQKQISGPIGDQFGSLVSSSKRKWLGYWGLKMRRAGLEPAPPD
jgi:hypothetical protein